MMTVSVEQIPLLWSKARHGGNREGSRQAGVSVIE